MILTKIRFNNSWYLSHLLHNEQHILKQTFQLISLFFLDIKGYQVFDTSSYSHLDCRFQNKSGCFILICSNGPYSCSSRRAVDHDDWSRYPEVHIIAARLLVTCILLSLINLAYLDSIALSILFRCSDLLSEFCYM